MKTVQSELDRRDFLKLAAMAPLALAVAPKSAGTIFWTRTAQQMDGFGASAAFHMAQNLRNFPDDSRNQMLDLLFSRSRGAGLSVVRNIVGDGGSWGTPQNGPTLSIEPQEGVWNWTGDEEQIWFMQEAAARGCTRYMSTVWSPPAWMKTNGDVIQGFLRPDKFQAFADYLSMYVRGYREHHGIDIYAISPSNEPDITVKYSSCWWTGEQFHTFLKDALIPAFARDNVTAKLILGEHSHWTEDPVLPSLDDPATEPRVDIVAAHAYAGADGHTPFVPLSLRTGNFVESRRLKKTIWQTEVGGDGPEIPGIRDALYWAKVIHTHVAEDGVSAWFFWWAVNTHDDRGALIHLDMEKQTFVAANRLYSIGNYSRFVRPGYVRLQTDIDPTPGVYISAFKGDASRTLVVVAINENDDARPLEAHLDGASAASASVFRTSESENLAALPDLPIASNTLKASLAPASVTTFVAAISAP